MRCVDSGCFNFRHLIRLGWEVDLIRGGLPRRHDRLSPAMARRQIDRSRASRAKSSLRLQHFLRWKRLRFFARPFHCRLFPPRRPARPVFPEPEITHGRTTVGAPFLRRCCSLRKPNGSCVAPKSEMLTGGWPIPQLHTSRQLKARMEFAGAALFAFFFSAKGATLAAPATLCWKLGGCALKSPTHAPAPAPASSVSAGPTCLAEARSFVRPCLPPSLLQGHDTESPVEVQEERLHSAGLGTGWTAFSVGKKNGPAPLWRVNCGLR